MIENGVSCYPDSWWTAGLQWFGTVRLLQHDPNLLREHSGTLDRDPDTCVGALRYDISSTNWKLLIQLCES